MNKKPPAIKKCPFCHTAGVLRHDFCGFWVECEGKTTCGGAPSTVFCYTPDDAILRWNTRGCQVAKSKRKK